MRTINGYILLLLIGTMAAASATDGNHLFSAKITSVVKSGRKYTVEVSLENISSGYGSLHVKAPDQWGYTKFATKVAGGVVVSTSTATYSEGGYRGIVFHKGDKFTFKFEGEATDDGSITFGKMDEKLNVFAKDADIRVVFNLFVADFNSGKCQSETVETDWRKLEFPFPTHPVDAGNPRTKVPMPPESQKLPK